MTGIRLLEPVQELIDKHEEQIAQVDQYLEDQEPRVYLVGENHSQSGHMRFVNGLVEVVQPKDLLIELEEERHDPKGSIYTVEKVLEAHDLGHRLGDFVRILCTDSTGEVDSELETAKQQLLVTPHHDLTGDEMDQVLNTLKKIYTLEMADLHAKLSEQEKVFRREWLSQLTHPDKDVVKAEILYERYEAVKDTRVFLENPYISGLKSITQLNDVMDINETYGVGMGIKLYTIGKLLYDYHVLFRGLKRDLSGSKDFDTGRTYDKFQTAYLCDTYQITIRPFDDPTASKEYGRLRSHGELTAQKRSELNEKREEAMSWILAERVVRGDIGSVLAYGGSHHFRDESQIIRDLQGASIPYVRIVLRVPNNVEGFMGLLMYEARGQDIQRKAQAAHTSQASS